MAFDPFAEARPWQRPSRPYSGGGMKDYGEGNPFYVGSPVGGGQQQSPWGGGMPWGGGSPMQQGPSFAEMKGLFDQTIGDVRGQLGGGADLGRFGALGSGVMEGVLNPQGFGQDVMNRQMTRLAEREAGNREMQLNALRNRAASGGFSRSTSFNDVGQNMRGQSIGRLNDAELNLLMQDAGLRNQSRGDMLRAALGLQGIEQGYRSQFADILANIQRPVGQGQGGAQGGLPGAAPGYRYINSRGEPLPFRPDGTPLSAWERQQALIERQQFLESQGMGAGGMWG